MQYADTNVIVAAYFETGGHTTTVERYLRKLRQPLVVGELAELECRSVFARKERQADSEVWQNLVARLDRGDWRREPVVWERLATQAKALSDRFAARLSYGSFDGLHVAAALVAGCSDFLSFDTNSNARVLAASARLKVWPELSPDERTRVVR
ncbi:MAG TPA: type II toxin-antitoxin system VapC family toxin [Verrucomicrobiota bacterium]|nr:type II toxin-antitoxin system VapC family toxin [Verrucomicrobiota bacterium]